MARFGPSATTLFDDSDSESELEQFVRRTSFMDQEHDDDLGPSNLEFLSMMDDFDYPHELVYHHDWYHHPPRYPIYPRHTVRRTRPRRPTPVPVDEHSGRPIYEPNDTLRRVWNSALNCARRARVCFF